MLRLSPFLTKLSGFSVHDTIGGQQMNWLLHNEIYFMLVQLFSLIYPAFIEYFSKINAEVSRVDLNYSYFSFLFVNIFSLIQVHMDFEYPYKRIADWNIFSQVTSTLHSLFR